LPLTPAQRAQVDQARAEARASVAAARQQRRVVRQLPGESPSAYMARIAAANPRSTPVGDALGTVAGSLLDYVSRPAYMVADIIQGDIPSLGKNALNLLAPERRQSSRSPAAGNGSARRSRSAASTSAEVSPASWAGLRLT